MSKKHLLLFLISIAFHLFGYYTLIQRIEPFQYFSYLVFWWSYIVLIDTVLAVRLKRFIVINKNLPFLIIISSGFWCIYELINLRLENWFYINLPDNLFLRWTGYILSYGTVIPAVYATKELLRSLIGEIRVKPFPVGNYAMSAIHVGFVTLILTLAIPTHFFPLAWIFLALMIDGYNYRKGLPSFMKEKEQGMAGNLLATVLSGIICGFLWETWNFWSISKWVYTVPFFENVKIFEMPLPGYLGFVPFALGVITFVHLLKGLKIYKRYLIRATSAALVFSLFSFAMIDRGTVFSYVTRLENLSFLEKTTLDRLEAAQVKSSFGIDPAVLGPKEKEALELIHLRGLGHENYLKLNSHGIDSVRSLSQSDETTVSHILNEPNMRRVRVYLRAARRISSS